MDKEQLVQELGALSGELGALSAYLKNGSASISMGNTVVIQSRILPDILALNWQNVSNTAEQQVAASETVISELKELQVRLNQLSLRTENVLAALKKSFTPVAKRKDWPEMKAGLVERLRQSGLSDEAIGQHLKRLEESTYGKYAAGLRNAIFRLEDTLNDRFTIALAHYMGNSLAYFAAQFNRRAQGPANNNQDIDAYVQSVTNNLGKKEKELFSALKSGDLQDAALKGDNLANFCLEELNDTILDLAAASYLRRQRPGSDVATGRSAAKLGDLIRMLLFDVAAGRYGQWVGGYNGKLHLSQQWVRQAGKLAFSPLDNTAPSVKISTLTARPDQYDGEEITIEGRITGVTIRHRGRKAISSAQVEDENGEQVVIAMPYIKLDSGGIVPGSFARITGVWLDSNKEAEGQPALDIDRVDLTGLSKSNWAAWLTLQLRGIFEPVPHTLNAAYSWEAGPTGAISPIRYSVFNANTQN